MNESIRKYPQVDIQDYQESMRGLFSKYDLASSPQELCPLCRQPFHALKKVTGKRTGVVHIFQHRKIDSNYQYLNCTVKDDELEKLIKRNENMAIRYWDICPIMSMLPNCFVCKKEIDKVRFSKRKTTTGREIVTYAFIHKGGESNCQINRDKYLKLVNLRMGRD